MLACLESEGPAHTAAVKPERVNIPERLMGAYTSMLLYWHHFVTYATCIVLKFFGYGDQWQNTCDSALPVKSNWLE